MNKNGKRHFVGMAGMHGCLPNYLTWNTSYNLVADDLASVHELSSRLRRELRRDAYLELNLHKFGNEYCEIVECSCNNPQEHEGF
jgi:hypothetical protein